MGDDVLLMTRQLSVPTRECRVNLRQSIKEHARMYRGSVENETDKLP